MESAARAWLARELDQPPRYCYSDEMAQLRTYLLQNLDSGAMRTIFCYYEGDRQGLQKFLAEFFFTYSVATESYAGPVRTPVDVRFVCINASACAVALCRSLSP